MYFVVSCFYWESVEKELKKKQKKTKKTTEQNKTNKQKTTRKTPNKQALFFFISLCIQSSSWSSCLETKQVNATRKIGKKKKKRLSVWVWPPLFQVLCKYMCEIYDSSHVLYFHTLFSLVVKLSWKISNICYYPNRETTFALVGKNRYFLLNSAKI